MQSTMTPRSLIRPIVLLVLLCTAALLLTTRTSHAQSASHTVQPGESLSAIARTYGTDVATLMRINGISDANLIRSGQKLAVPGGPLGSGAGRIIGEMESDAPLLSAGEETRIYVTQPGDTLSTIAVRIGTTAARLAELNQRPPSERPHVGDALPGPGKVETDVPVPRDEGNHGAGQN